MFSPGHLIWIGISALLIAGGLALCFRLRPPMQRLVKVCLVIGFLSEIIKFLSVIEIVPVVEPVISQQADEPQLQWSEAGEYTPYIRMEHLPFELCSLFLAFLLLALFIRNETWKKWLYAVMFASGTLGGIMGIVLTEK